MLRILSTAALTLALLASFAPGQDFQRERKGEAGKAKDAIEGKPAPALTVANWMNTDGKALDLKALRGKVVIIDFWGTW